MRMLFILIFLLGCESWPMPEDPKLPEPTPKPQLPASIFYVPSAVPLHTPVVFSLCDVNQKSPIVLFADDYSLGYMGLNSKSKCHQLIYPGFNTPGQREIKAGSRIKVLWVLEH